MIQFKCTMPQTSHDLFFRIEFGSELDVIISMNCVHCNNVHNIQTLWWGERRMRNKTSAKCQSNMTFKHWTPPPKYFIFGSAFCQRCVVFLILTSGRHSQSVDSVTIYDKIFVTNQWIRSCFICFNLAHTNDALQLYLFAKWTLQYLSMHKNLIWFLE